MGRTNCTGVDGLWLSVRIQSGTSVGASMEILFDDAVSLEAGGLLFIFVVTVCNTIISWSEHARDDDGTTAAVFAENLVTLKLSRRCCFPDSVSTERFRGMGGDGSLFRIDAAAIAPMFSTVAMILPVPFCKSLPTFSLASMETDVSIGESRFRDNGVGVNCLTAEALVGAFS